MGVTAKICGLSTEEAVTAASAGGAAYVGFVFYPPSPRAVTPQRAAELCARVPARIARVGLFVDAEDRTIEAVRISRAAAVDVSSGIESRLGVKDLDKIRAFLAAAGTL